MAQMNPSPSKPVVRYPTALLEDKELITIHDSRLPDYKALEYGTPYSDQNKFPGLKLIFQEPLGEDDRMVRRVWAGDRQDQDLYNADRKYSGGSTEHPILVRRYLFPEAGYEPLPTGTPDSQFPEAVLVEEEVTQPENRNGYLAVTRVFETIPGPVLTGKLVTDKGQVATITTQVVAPGTTVTPSALTVSASVKPDSKGKSVLEKVEVAEVFAEKVFSAERPDPVPEKFRVAVPTETIEETLIGTAGKPTLAGGEIAESEQQVTSFTKRTRKVLRAPTALPKTLTQRDTNEERQVVYVEEKLQLGDTSRTPTATVAVRSEALGDGSYVVQVRDQVEVFTENTFSAELVDNTPQKFRAKIPIRTEERVVPGQASVPQLLPGELSQSFSQVDRHKVRRRTVKRPSTALPVVLTQVETNEVGQKVIVTETLKEGDTSETPTATISLQSEDLGDGKYVVRKTEVPEVFSGNSYSLDRPDPVPEKFRVAVPSVSEESVVVGTVPTTPPSLTAGELSSTEQQITKFTKRKRKVKRALSSLPTSLTQSVTNDRGQLVEIRETLQQGSLTSSQQPSATKVVESESLGDGTYLVKESTVPEVFQARKLEAQVDDSLPERFRGSIKTEISEQVVVGQLPSTINLQSNQIAYSEEQVTAFTKRTRAVSRPQASSFPQLKGQIYDASANVVFPYTENLANNSGYLNQDRTEITPVTKDLSVIRQVDTTALQSQLNSVHIRFPGRTNLSLPPVLKAIEVVWDTSSDTGSYTGTGNGSGSGQSWGYEFRLRGEAKATASVTPSWKIDLVEVWSSGVPTTNHVFFLSGEPKSKDFRSEILAKVGAQREWPVFKPQSHVLTAFGKQVSVGLNGDGGRSQSSSNSGSSNSSSSGSGESSSNSISSVIARIPACLHSNIRIKSESPPCNGWVRIGQDTFAPNPLNPDQPVNISPLPFRYREFKAESTVDYTLSATSPAKIPTSGVYLLECRVETYQYGFVKVYAETIDASIFA